MNDLVWNHVRDDYRKDAEDNLTARGTRQGAMQVSNGASVWVGRDKVSYTRAVMHCLKPKGDSPKRAYRWQTIDSFGFRRLHTGTIVPYHCMRDSEPSKPVPWRNVTAGSVFEFLANEPGEGAEAFRVALRHYMGIREFVDLFPVAPRMGCHKYMAMPWTIRGCYRGADPAEFVARAFGKTRVVDSLTQAVVTANPTLTAIATQMRGIVEPENIAHWLNVNEEYQDEWIETPSLRKVFLKVNPRTVKYLAYKKLSLSDMKSISHFQWRAKDEADKKLQRIDPAKTYLSFSDLAMV